MDIFKMKSILIRHEDLKLKPYLCPAGKLTIGVGRNLEAKGVSYEEADFMLLNDIGDALREVEEIFPNVDGFSENRQMALVDMAFNLGKGGLAGFEKMVEAIRLGDWEKASEEALDSLWAKQVGTRAEEDAWMIKTG